MRILLPLLLVATLAHSATAQQVDHLAIVLIDVSPSMKDRLPEAWSQLRDILNDHPPSSQQPLVVIQYAGTVRSTKRFTSLKPALVFVGTKPKSGWTTNHPTGLGAALRALNRITSQKTAVSIYWIADGNDVLDDSTIAVAKKIDAFFAKRQEDSFGPSINLWAWSGAPSPTRGLTALTDALPHMAVNTGSFDDLRKAVHSIAADPQLKLVGALGPNDKGILTVTLEPSLRASAAAVGKLHQYTFTLRGPIQPKGGSLRFEVEPNKPAIVHQVLLPLSPALRRQTSLILQFDATAVPKCKSAKCKLPFPSKQITLTVPITPPTAVYALHARANLTGKPQWHDPAKLIAAYSINVQVATVCRKFAPAKHAPISVSIGAKQGHSLSNTREVAITAPGKLGVQTVSLQLLVPVSPTANAEDVLASQLTLAIAKIPANTNYLPPNVVVHLPKLPLPPPIVSKVSFRTISLSPPLWYEQPDIALFRAEIDIHVDGPCSADLVVINDPKVTRYLTSPAKIHSGHQRGEFLVAAHMAPAPAKTTLAFPVRVSNLEGPFKIELPQAITFEVTGPPQLQLVAYHRRRSGVFQFAVHPGNRTTTFPVTLDLEGPHLPNFAKGLRITSRGVSPAGVAGNTLPLLQPVIVKCPLPSTGADSYATDSRHTIAMAFEPSQPTAAVLSCQENANVTRYALLKQHLLVGFVVALVVSLPIGVFYLIRSLRPSSTATFI